jgi:hypothetical protein
MASSALDAGALCRASTMGAPKLYIRAKGITLCAAIEKTGAEVYEIVPGAAGLLMLETNSPRRIHENQITSNPQGNPNPSGPRREPRFAKDIAKAGKG